MVEWVDVNVLVNLVDANDADYVEAVIKKANTILQQARIRLILKKVNKDVETGNGDADLTDAEGYKAVEEGKKELEKAFGAGKGLKITVTDDVWTEKPNTVGWSIHRNPVIFVEKDADPNLMGNTVAHELGHIFTLEHREDANDVTNLMSLVRVLGHNILDVNQADEIFMEIKKRGTTYLRVPEPLPAEGETGSAGVVYPFRGFGAVFDGLGDVLVTDPLTGIVQESNDPAFSLADVDEILIGIDDPYNPGGFVNTQILLGDTIPHENIEFFADFSFYIYEEGTQPEYPPDATATIYRTEGIWYSELYNPSFFTWPVGEPQIFENERFDTGLPEVLVNQTLQLLIPVESLNGALSGSFVLGNSHYILVHGNTWVADYRNNDVTPTILQDTTDFTYILPEGPPPGPQIHFTHTGISGHGFTPFSDVGIWLDSSMVDTTQAIDDGSFESVFPSLVEPLPGPGDNTPLPPFRSGVHSVLVIENDDSGPHGAPHAIGFFEVPFGQVGDDAELINGALSLDNHSTTFDPDDNRAPAGVFTCTAAFTNNTQTNFSNVFFEIDTLTGDNRVLNALDGGKEGARIPAPVVLNAGDSFESVFEIGLENPGPFSFFVNAFGTPDVLIDHSGGSIDLTPQPTTPIDNTFVIDNFLDPVGPLNEFTRNTNILGGERDFAFTLSGDGATGEFLSTGNSFNANLNFGDFGFGGADLIYDGLDESQDLDFRGLGGIDLTNGGQSDQFVIKVNNVEGTWFLQIFIHTDENNFFGGGGELPTDGPFPQDVIFPFDSFNSVGNPDLTDTGLIGVFLQNSHGAGEQTTSVELDSILIN
ncbi:MAG: hypothetical protein JXA81_03425 [Sedimentisphaerales bacterium]|nr:hypothetical protein [Sedimentisphaerales bacterium]